MRTLSEERLTSETRALAMVAAVVLLVLPPPGSLTRRPAGTWRPTDLEEMTGRSCRMVFGAMEVIDLVDSL